MSVKVGVKVPSVSKKTVKRH